MEKKFKNPLRDSESGLAVRLYKLDAGVFFFKQPIYIVSALHSSALHSSTRTLYCVLKAPEFISASKSKNMVYLVLDVLQNRTLFYRARMTVWLAKPPEDEETLMKILPFTFITFKREGPSDTNL